MASYAVPSDLLLRRDARSVGDLVNDVGQRQTPGQLLTDPVIQAMLDDATGIINAAINFAERYTPTELSALTGTDKALLVRICTDLAFGLLIERRGNDPKIDAGYVESMRMLEALREGKLLFNVPGDVADGVPSISFPSVCARRTINLARDAAYRFFPVRRHQTPSSD